MTKEQEESWSEDVEQYVAEEEDLLNSSRSFADNLAQALIETYGKDNRQEKYAYRAHG